jgi:hypothetical protein
MVIPTTRTANVAAIEGAIHLFRERAPRAKKMTAATIAPSTSPITVLLFCA